MVEARFLFGYSKVAYPGPQAAPKLAAALAAKNSYQVPTVAYPAGMLLATGKYHASV